MKWLNCVLSTYLYGAFDFMLLSCHVRTSFRVNPHSVVCRNVKELLAWSRHHIGKFGDQIGKYLKQNNSEYIYRNFLNKIRKIVDRDYTFREATECLEFLLFFWRTKYVNQKWKRGFPMMGKLYSFSYNKTKSLRMFPKKVNQSKKILRKAKCTAI